MSFNNSMPILSPIEPALTSSAYRNAPIGVMDSGVGGFSIMRELHRLLPHEDFIFIGDQANVPYGEKPLKQVQDYVEGIVNFFLAGHYKQEDPILRTTKLIVIACNTASAAALQPMRHRFPQIKFVGLEPAVKPAALNSQTQRIGVIATRATFQGELFASLVDRYGQDVEVFTRACPEFVEMVERGTDFTEEDQEVVCQSLAPLLEHDIDQLVLGCTHFPFLKPLIKNCLEDDVKIVDPSRPVAKQVLRVLSDAEALTSRTASGSISYATTGNMDNFQRQFKEMVNLKGTDIRQLVWRDGHLSVSATTS